MPFRPKRSWVEKAAVRLGVIPASPGDSDDAPASAQSGALHHSGNHRLETGATSNDRLETGSAPNDRLETGAAPNDRLEADTTSNSRLEAGATCSESQISNLKTLRRAPSPEAWGDHVEYDPKAWPKTAEARHYRLIPTTCFNC